MVVARRAETVTLVLMGTMVRQSVVLRQDSASATSAGHEFHARQTNVRTHKIRRLRKTYQQEVLPRCLSGKLE